MRIPGSSLGLVAVAGVVLAACDGSTNVPRNPAGDQAPPSASIVPQNRSVTPALVKGLPDGVRAFSLVGSDDTLPGTPNFIFGGSADGAGFLKNPDGTFTLVTNHEDNFAVSRVYFDRDLKPVSAQYVIQSQVGRWRLCSATLATVEEHGFGPVFFTVGESGIESQIHAMDPNGAPNSSRLVPAFGRWNSENAVPLPKTAFPGRTVVIIGDDDSGTNGGQVAMYVSNTVGDIDNGDLYVLARTDNVQRERSIVKGTRYPVEFRKIDNQRTLTGAQIEAAGNALSMLQFGRVEDLDYRKGGAAAAREIYFNATGQNNTGVNADYSRTKYGRVYRLILDENNPLRGTLEVILDGDAPGAVRGQAGNIESMFQNPDNITATENFLYIKEDPNGYRDETHDAYIYQYDLRTGATRVVMELDHQRTASNAAKYNVGGPSRFGDWEYGAMIDVSKELGLPSAFIIAIQPHTWTGDRYRNADGGTLRPNENQASQMILVTGLPR